MKNNLRVERARVRMTQQELADKTGVTRQTIVAIEQGKFNPSTVLALKMARVFGVTIEALFELEETDYNNKKRRFSCQLQNIVIYLLYMSYSFCSN